MSALLIIAALIVLILINVPIAVAICAEGARSGARSQ